MYNDELPYSNDSSLYSSPSVIRVLRAKTHRTC